MGTGGAGMAGAGAASAPGGAPGGAPGTGGNPATGGSTSGGEGGAGGGQSDTTAVQAAASSGCSCAIGADAKRASTGYIIVVLGALGLVLNRRRPRRKSRQ
jgi:hypothetical protein